MKVMPAVVVVSLVDIMDTLLMVVQVILVLKL